MEKFGNCYEIKKIITTELIYITGLAMEALKKQEGLHTKLLTLTGRSFIMLLLMLQLVYFSFYFFIFCIFIDKIRHWILLLTRFK